MKVLVLGGTRFLGRHIVEAALARDHEVTLFNRGQSNPDLFADLEKLTGDRDGGLDALEGRSWDVAIDPSGYVPRLVKASAELLADSVEHYTFVSSISVYSGLDTPHMDESGAVGTIADETVEEITGETYGPLKVLCEKAAEAALPGRVLHVRSGLIVGPHDLSNRFTYWPVRVAKGGDVLAPVSPDFPVQYIDGRDQAEWIIRMAEDRKAGVYNVTGPDYNATLGHVLDVSKEVSGSDANFVWADADFLAEHEVAPWMGLPLWVPDDTRALNQMNIDKALADGLTFRPLAATIRDTLAWFAEQPADRQWPAGISAEKEADVLAAWKAKVS